jgi:hypothetical protein
MEISNYGRNGARSAWPRRLECGVERNPPARRACAVAAAAAHEINDDLTVILNSVTKSIERLEPDHPARAFLLDLQGAAQRCVFTASGLLNYSARHGVATVRTRFDRLLER